MSDAHACAGRQWKPDGADAKDKVGEYKFPFCDIVGGSPKAMPAALRAVAQMAPKAGIP